MGGGGTLVGAKKTISVLICNFNPKNFECTEPKSNQRKEISKVNIMQKYR